jgi:hypothetical protein
MDKTNIKPINTLKMTTIMTLKGSLMALFVRELKLAK